jgi:hypothetical protein
MICSEPQCIEPALYLEFNDNKDFLEDLEAFPYLELVEHIADSQFQPPISPLPWMDVHPVTAALLSKYFAVLSQRDTQGCLDITLQNHPDYPFAMREEYKYI